MMRTAQIVGAGFVGLSCARALQREGFAVTVLDREGPCAGASFGNAAQIATASVIPQATPGILRQTVRLLRDPDGPLILRPGYVLRHARWFRRFVAQATRERLDAGADLFGALMARAWPAWHALLADADASSLVQASGALHVFSSVAAREAAQGAYSTRRRLGVPWEDLTMDEARRREPALGPRAQAAVWMPDMGCVPDTRALARKLAERIAADGGRIERAEVTGISASGVRVDGTWRAGDLTVLAAGAWSQRFADDLGVEVPIVSERGYHRMFAPGSSALATPVLLVERKVAVTPMADGIRVASVAEFAPPDAPPDYARAARVFGGLEGFVAGLGGEPVSEWVGPRPSTPDSRPIIGWSPRVRNVMLAYGHGHLGLTLAALTGELVAGMVLARTAPVDLGALAPRLAQRQRP